MLSSLLVSSRSATASFSPYEALSEAGYLLVALRLGSDGRSSDAAQQSPAYRGVLSFRSEARERPDSEAPRVHHAARQRDTAYPDHRDDRALLLDGAPCCSLLTPANPSPLRRFVTERQRCLILAARPSICCTVIIHDVLGCCPRLEGNAHEATQFHRWSWWGTDPPSGDRAACSDWTTADPS
jgi:hypothetical protein